VKTVPGKVVLAGGLDHENIQTIIARYKPYGIDVSSSVEVSPGVKSEALMARFMEAVTAARLQ